MPLMELITCINRCENIRTIFFFFIISSKSITGKKIIEIKSSSVILAIFQDFKNCNVVKIRNGNKDKYGEIFA